MGSQDKTSEIDIRWDHIKGTDWEAALRAVPYAAYQQNFTYGSVIAEMGTQIHRAEIMVDGTPIGLAQMQVRRWFGLFTFCLIMRGPLWLQEGLSLEVKAAALKKLSDTVPVKGLHTVFIMPEGSDDGATKAAGLSCIMSGYHTVLLDLTADEDTLRKRLNGKWRNRLKASEKEDLTITPMGKTPGKYQWLLEAEEKHQEQAGYRALPTAMVPAYHKALGKKSVLAYEAKRSDERVGAMLFLRHGENATYHIGWASDAGKEMNIHNRLLWESMLTLKKAGVRIIDLGGINTDYIPGIARFKIGTGGEVLSMSGTWTKGPRWR